MPFKNFIYRFVRMLPGIFRSKRLLIVRLDAIGDYILFRNGLQVLKKSARFSNYKFTLLGNKLWKDLAESLDTDVIDNFVWIDPAILYNRNKFSFERLKLLAHLKLKGFQVAIHPVHSRILGVDLFIDDLKIPITIASSGDTTNYQNNNKLLADKVYDQLITVPDNSTFEFLRNREFISALTSVDSSTIALEIKNTAQKSDALMVVIAPGAGHIQRRWAAENFASVIRNIQHTYPKAIFYLCGSSADLDAGNIIQNKTTGCNVENYCGKQTLTQFVETIQKTSLLIANESSAVHIAAALNIPAVCISNGNMFGRFNPYPTVLNKPIHTLYPDTSFYNIGETENLIEKTRIKSEFDISNITVSEVTEKCFKIVDSIYTSLKLRRTQ